MAALVGQDLGVEGLGFEELGRRAEEEGWDLDEDALWGRAG